MLEAVSALEGNRIAVAEERVQRRLAAILAADGVGYSPLMERDEAGTLAAAKARRREVLDPLVVKHDGRIFNVIGDGGLGRVRQRHQRHALPPPAPRPRCRTGARPLRVTILVAS